MPQESLALLKKRPNTFYTSREALQTAGRERNSNVTTVALAVTVKRSGKKLVLEVDQMLAHELALIMYSK